MQKTFANATMYNGEAYSLLRQLPSDSVNAILTDPPYSSGGMTMDSRQRPPADKYQNSDSQRIYPTFTGDNRDQRSFLVWATLWLTEAHRVAKPGASCLVFTDWRQLPTMTDALQAGGWIWRNILVWTKPNSRPSLGDFRRQCEYLVVGTKGKFAPAHRQCLPGVFTHSVVTSARRKHLTEKPIPLLQELLAVVPEGGTVLDPFAGSATTGAACLATGRKFIGFEMTQEYFKIACERLQELAA